jgi:nitrogenase molybdenum-iron protein alpha/beta subunit
MSDVKGRFGIDVLFTDSTVAGGAKSLKTITLQHATEYDAGKVAVVSGTCGTAVVSVPVAPTTYRNAAGSLVSFASVSRVAFSATGAAMVACDGSGGCGENDWTIYSRAGQVAVSEAVETASFSINVMGTAGTAAYTLVMYGS